MNTLSAWYHYTSDPYYYNNIHTYKYVLRGRYGMNAAANLAQTQELSIYDNTNAGNNNNNDLITSNDRQVATLSQYKNSMDISFNAWKLRYKILEELFFKYTSDLSRITFEQCVDLYMDLYKTENTPLACQYASLTFHIAGKEFYKTLSLDGFLYSYREMYKWL